MTTKSRPKQNTKEPLRQSSMAKMTSVDSDIHQMGGPVADVETDPTSLNRISLNPAANAFADIVMREMVDEDSVAVPSERSAQPLHQNTMMQIQQKQGNRAAQSLLPQTQVSEKNSATTSPHFSSTRTQIIQRSLSSPRFANDVTLENISDGNATMKRGDESDSVRKVQHGIHDSGILFLGHGVDGKFGRETERHVTRFQHRHRITTDPTGEVGSATIDKLDQLFPAVALPTSATDPYAFAGMLEILCQWNSAMVRDLRNLYVQMVADLEWADEEFDGSNWVPKPMPGAGETSGFSITIATNGRTNEEVAKALYHEYQHARSPVVYRSGDWSNEETRAYNMETHWAIDRGLSPDSDLTTTNPVTGEVEVDQAGIGATVESYPGLDAANPGEVIGKVGRHRVRVRMPDGRITVRNAVAGDSVPGPRRITPPRHFVRDSEWRC